MREEWRGFKGGHWLRDVNVRDFIQENYTPYDGNADFLADSTAGTDRLFPVRESPPLPPDPHKNEKRPMPGRFFYAIFCLCGRKKWGKLSTDGKNGVHSGKAIRQ